MFSDVLINLLFQKYEMQRTRDELCTLDINLQKSEKSNSILNNEINTLKTDLTCRNDEIKNLHELIGKIQEDKSKQTKKISKLIENGNIHFLT